MKQNVYIRMLNQLFNSMKKLFFTASALLSSSLFITSFAQSTTTPVSETKEVAVKKEGEQSSTVTPSEIKPVRMQAVKLNATQIQRITPINSTVAPPVKEEENQTPPNQK